MISNTTGKPALVPDACLETIVICLLNQSASDEFPRVLYRDVAIYPGKPFSQVLTILIHYSKHCLRILFFVCAQFAIIVDPDDQHRSEEHTSELQSHSDLVCRLLLEKKNST